MAGSPKKRAKREAAAKAAEEVIPPKPKREPDPPRLPKKGGPGKRCQELEDEVIARLSAGETLRAICRDPHIPGRGNVSAWCVDDPDGFGARFSKARELGCLEVADEFSQSLTTLAATWLRKTTAPMS